MRSGIFLSTTNHRVKLTISVAELRLNLTNSFVAISKLNDELIGVLSARQVLTAAVSVTKCREPFDSIGDFDDYDGGDEANRSVSSGGEAPVLRNAAEPDQSDDEQFHYTSFDRKRPKSPPHRPVR